MPQSNFIKVGEIVAAHGLKGEVKIKVYTTTPEAFLDYVFFYNTEGHLFDLKTGKIINSNYVKASFKGVVDRTIAENLIGQSLFIKKDQRSPLSKEEYYYDDLIGLTIIDEKNKVYGKVIRVDNFGSCDILVCTDEQGKEFSIPFIKDAVLRVDIACAHITVAPTMIVS